jgi:hypothetical protein
MIELTHEDDVESFGPPLESLQCNQTILGGFVLPSNLFHICCKQHHVDGIIPCVY